MSIRTANIIIKGISPLLQSNPQTVDRFNNFAKRMAAINAKKTRRTDEDYLELADLEVESKVYFDPSLGIYVPTKWLHEAVACNGFKVAKLSRDTIRGSLFTTEDKAALSYRDSNKVKTVTDIIGNPVFRTKLILPQGQVRVAKTFPSFHEWSFSTTLEFDDKQIDADSLTRIVQHAAKYNGFGDFRPTFGRAIAEVTHE